jgi:peroxiredoxin|tara:strand:+ start:1396 stop:1908 length:513 start_codon:yes stop_codon:yes gene_type:complete
MEGTRLTDQVFYMREDNDWVLKRTQDLFNDKDVVVFGLPGAFTPTCSAFQLPKFEELYDNFKDLGMDEVYCTAVNDSFVMNAWFDQQGITKVKPLPDGNADFARSTGMLNDFTNRGFGERSWRYSMYVKNGEIKLRYAEWGYPEACPIQDPFEVSGAEKMLEALKHIKAN